MIASMVQVFAAAWAIASFQGSSQTAALPDVFTVGASEVEAIWAKGFDDGVHRRNSDKVAKANVKGIDSYHTTMTSKATCAWAGFINPRTVAYLRAYKAGSQHWSKEEVEKAKASLLEESVGEQRYAVFRVVLNEMPSFNAPYGRLSRTANPSNLTDVRCVLKVGEDFIQPTKQPGDLTISKYDGVQISLIPNTTYVHGRERTSVSGSFGGESIYATGTTTTSYAVTTYNAQGTNYSSYGGQFVVYFPLRNEKGEPVLSAQNPVVELLVTKQSRELKASFKLADLNSPFAK